MGTAQYMYYILALLSFIPILLLAHCRGMRRCASMKTASSIDCLSIELAKIKVWVKDGIPSFIAVRPTPRSLYLSVLLRVDYLAH